MYSLAQIYWHGTCFVRHRDGRERRRQGTARRFDRCCVRRSGAFQQRSGRGLAARYARGHKHPRAEASLVFREPRAASHRSAALTSWAPRVCGRAPARPEQRSQVPPGEVERPALGRSSTPTPAVPQPRASAASETWRRCAFEPAPRARLSSSAHPRTFYQNRNRPSAPPPSAGALGRFSRRLRGTGPVSPADLHRHR